MEEVPVQLPNGDLGCPYCKTQLVNGKSPYYCKGVRVGAFDSVRCQFCGFYVLSDEGRMKSLDALIELGLISVEEDTTETVTPVFDVLCPAITQTSRVLPAEEMKETSTSSAPVPLTAIHNASIAVSRYRL